MTTMYPREVLKVSWPIDKPVLWGRNTMFVDQEFPAAIEKASFARKWNTSLF